MRLSSLFTMLGLVTLTAGSVMACAATDEEDPSTGSEETASGEDEELRAAVFDEGDDGKTVQVALGRSFTIALSDNGASTGYRWKVTSVDRSLGYPKESSIPGEPNRPGSPGIAKFTWSTKSPLNLVGKHKIEITKIRSFAPNAPGTKYTLTVDIVPPSSTVAKCGGLAGLKCGANEYCEYTAKQACGMADQMGKCQPKPQYCATVIMPVCGCDFKTYKNACTAMRAGVDARMSGPCPGN